MAKTNNMFQAAVLVVLGLLVVALIVGATNYHYFWPAKARAEHAVSAYGMKDVKLDRTYFGLGCSKEDRIHYKFKATNATGAPVDGVVCMGIFKAATVRVN